MRTLGRIIAATALAPWLVVSSALAPEHVHESEAADHHASQAHRHFAPHDHARGDLLHLDHDGAEISDVDDLVVWLDEVGIAETSHSFPEFLIALATHVASLPSPVVHVAVVADEATLPHGPPSLSVGLRAPPSRLPLT
jgi:hypothetical protein